MHALGVVERIVGGVACVALKAQFVVLHTHLAIKRCRPRNAQAAVRSLAHRARGACGVSSVTIVARAQAEVSPAELTAATRTKYVSAGCSGTLGSAHKIVAPDAPAGRYEKVGNDRFATSIACRGSTLSVTRTEGQSGFAPKPQKRQFCPIPPALQPTPLNSSVAGSKHATSLKHVSTGLAVQLCGHISLEAVPAGATFHDLRGAISSVYAVMLVSESENPCQHTKRSRSDFCPYAPTP
eukprot:scaffold133332_cov78-Phaeocystis_antarctica.AAC.1